MSPAPVAAFLLARLRRGGCRIDTVGDEIEITAPRGFLTPGLKQRLIESKADLRAQLEAERERPDQPLVGSAPDWSPAERRALASLPGLTQSDLEALGRLQAAFGVEIVSAGPDEGQPADPAPVQPSRSVCFMCRQRRFWRSIHGSVVCGNCHPPPAEDLVAEWLDGAASTDDTTP